jgi:hypothetical protein
MQLSEIQTQAKYMDDNYAEFKGKILNYRPEGVVVVWDERNNRKMEFAISDESVRTSLYRRLGVHIIQKALIKRFQYSPSRELITDEVTALALVKQKRTSVFIYDKSNSSLKGVMDFMYHRLPCNNVLTDAIEIYGKEIDPRFSYITPAEMKVYFKSPDEVVAPISKELIRFGYLIRNGEIGNVGLSVRKALTFLRCTNGMIMDEIEFKVSYRHIIELQEKFRGTLQYYQKDSRIADMIDSWVYNKSLQITRESIETPKGTKKLGKILSRYGVHAKEDQEGITNALLNTQEEVHTFNSYWLSNAMNYYASNVVHDPILANQLSLASYQLLTMY